MAVRQSGKIYYSNPDGKAPKGLGVGDIVITGKGGTWAVTGVNPDGSYQSTLVDANINKSNYNPTRESMAPQQTREQAWAETSRINDPNQAQLDALRKSYEGRGTGGSIGGTSGTPITGGLPPTPATGSPLSPTYSADIQNAIKQLGEAQKANQIAGLTSAMNKSLANLDTQQSRVKDTYYGERNKAAADADVGQYNFAQYMASRGVKGNAGAMPEIYRNAGLQNRLGGLGQQEAQANTAIENQRTLLRNNYESDVAAARAGVEAQNLEQYINQLNLDRSFSAEQAAADRNYELQMKNYLDQQTQRERESYAANIGAYHNDYQAEINRIQDDGDPTNDWMIQYLQAARNQKLMDQQNAAANSAQQEFENWLAMQKLNTSKSSGSSGVKPQTISQLDSDMNDIYRMNLDPVSGTLSESGAAQLRNYAMAYGGQYSDQLLSKWIGGQTPAPAAPGGTPANQQSSGYYNIYNYAQSLRARGSSPDEIANFLTARIGNQITDNEAVQIARALGLPV